MIECWPFRVIILGLVEVMHPVEGTWAWVTGESWSYSNWGTNQMDNDRELLTIYIFGMEEMNGMIS